MHKKNRSKKAFENHMRILLAVITIVGLSTLSGCNVGNSESQPSSSNTMSESGDGGAKDVATYVFHKGKSFAEVSKTIPDGSIDYLDMNTLISPSVIVIVTATAPTREGLRFTTTFTGDDGIQIEKNWEPSQGVEGDKHVGLFVLPAGVDAGHTTVH